MSRRCDLCNKELYLNDIDTVPLELYLTLCLTCANKTQVIEDPTKTAPEITDDITDCKFLIRDIAKALQNSPTKSRERSLAITKLEEAEMWLLRAHAEV